MIWRGVQLADAPGSFFAIWDFWHTWQESNLQASVLETGLSPLTQALGGGSRIRTCTEPAYETGELANAQSRRAEVLLDQNLR